MLKDMLIQLEKLGKFKVEKQHSCLVQGVEAKVHTPLMKRPKCGRFLLIYVFQYYLLIHIVCIVL